MKKISAFLFLLIVISVSVNSQGLYSKQNLAKASIDDLELYLDKAAKTTRTGAIFSTAGSAAFVSGLLLAGIASSGGTEGSYRFGLGLTVAGFCSSVIGLPILLTGTSRIKKVSDAKKALKGTASIKLNPSAFYNYEAQKFQPGISLTMRF